MMGCTKDSCLLELISVRVACDRPERVAPVVMTGADFDPGPVLRGRSRAARIWRL